MSANLGENLIPFYSRGKPVVVRTPEEMKTLILNSDDVRDAIAGLVRQKTQLYQHKF